MVLACSLVTGYGAIGNAPQVTNDEYISLLKDLTPQAGVRLLEDILQRMHDLPQLAQSRAKQMIALRSQAMASAEPGPTDPMLAIKPRDIPQQQYSRDSLVHSINNLYGTLKQFNKLTVPAPPAGTLASNGNSTPYASYKTPIIVAKQPLIQEFQSGGSGYGTAEPIAMGNLQSSPSQSETSKYVKEIVTKNSSVQNEQSIDVSDGMYNDAMYIKEYHPKPRRDALALLPPRIINGISLMRLGSSEKDAIHTLSSMGKTEHESINGWTVYSLKGNHSKCRLQVYSQHHIVEAIRIFDSDSISGNIGVQIGDGLANVKEKFGEPRFILSESTYAGQNYVYPISQISFQLARLKHAAPQVVSMLIFNIK
jgi:hypothetical protein